MNTPIKALMLASVAALSLSANAKVTANQSYGDWTGTCEGTECGIVQTVNDDKGLPIGRILIRKVPQADNATTLFVTVPLGVNLRAGMQFTVDGNELGVVPYDFCSESGCNVAVPLKSEELTKIQSGNTLQIGVFLGDQLQTLPFSLKGVTAGTKAL